MSPVRIVTDSTSDVPSAWRERLDIHVVPCFLNIGARSLRDGFDISREQFYRELPGYEAVPQTAAPPAGQFAELYAELGRGGDEIVSLHPAQQLSGIYNSARLGAQESGLPEGRVRVIDSGQLSMGLGWQVVAAAERAAQGADAAAIAAHLDALTGRVRVYAVLDTLEHLRRSGRVSWAQAGLGSMLQIKPLLELRAGQLRSVDRVRTRGRSLQRLVELARALGLCENLALLHANAPAEAADIRTQLAALVPPGAEVPIVDVTPVIGTHVGPRAVGVAAVVARRESIP